MPPKGGNAKKESGRAKKAENEVKKREAVAAEKERQEAAKWTQGAKADKAADAKAKQEAAAARKAEAARLLAEEEAAVSSSKPKAPKPKGLAKKATLPIAEPEVTGKGKGRVTEPDAGAAGSRSGSGSGAGAGSSDQDLNEVVQSFSASNLDDALDLLEVVNAKVDKSSVGNMASEIERHPERRFKAAYEAYVERELPELRKDHPGLRLQQYKDILYKNFQKSPENPFNQTTVFYNASKEEKIEALKRRQEEIEDRLREKKGVGLGSP